MTTDQVLFAAAIMMAVTAAALGLARRLNLGSIAGLLLVGIILGPHSPLPLFTRHVEDFEAIGEVGVILLLFMIGLDTQPRRLWSLRTMVFGFGSVAYVACVALTVALILETSAINSHSAVVLGLGLAMSSSAVPLPMLQLRGESDSPHGRMTLAADVLQSLVLVAVMIAVPLLGQSAEGAQPVLGAVRLLDALIALAAVWALGRWVLPMALSAVARGAAARVFTLAVLAGVFAAAWIMGHAGASMALGAFIMGVLLSTSSFAAQIKAAVMPARHLLLGVFFVAVGMAIDLKEAAAFRAELLFYLPAVLIVKLVGVYASARIFRAAPRTALLAGLLLMPLDEVGYVIFASAAASGLLSSKAHTLALLCISFSFVVSPLIIDLGLRSADRVRDRQGRAAVRSSDPSAARGRVIVVGYSELGHALCAVLEAAQVGYACFDTDPRRIIAARRLHYNVQYGDLADAALIEVAAVAQARLIVVTLEDLTRVREVLMALKARAPQAPVLTAVEHLAERDALLALGAGRVLALAPEGALAFTRAMFEVLAVDRERVATILGAVSANDYSVLRATGFAATVTHP